MTAAHRPCGLLALLVILCWLGCDSADGGRPDGDTADGLDSDVDADLETDAGADSDVDVVLDGDNDAPADSGDADADHDSGDPPRYVTHIEGIDHLTELADEELSVKYLAPLEWGEHAPPFDNTCVFQHMADTPWHLHFIVGFADWSWMTFEDYLAWVMVPETRRFWGGSLRYWPQAHHPVTGQVGVVSITVYAEDTPENTLTVEQLVAAYGQVTGCLGIAAETTVFLAEGAMQQLLISNQRAEIEQAGIAAVPLSALGSGG